MPEISQERRDELIVDYAQLKKLYAEVDNKYRLNYNDVVMDFPPDLGLVKLVHTPMTDGEIDLLAQRAVAPKYDEKARLAQKSSDAVRNRLQVASQRLSTAHTKKLSAMAAAYAEQQKQLLANLANRGLYRSSVRNAAEADAAAVYSEDVNREVSAYRVQLNSYQSQIDAEAVACRANLAAIESERRAAIAVEQQKLRDQDEKNRISVQKYNSSINEREAKYKASCERSYQYAKQAEYDRALNAAKIYSELGANGVESLKCTEKMEFSRMHFSHYTLDEAMFVLSLDGAVQSNLGSYYQSFVNWVNNTLH